MTRGRRLCGVITGALLPVALTWVAASATTSEDPWEKFRENQLLVTAAIPDCDAGILTIHGFYFAESALFIDVSLELMPLTVTFAGRPSHHGVVAARVLWSPRQLSADGDPATT